MDYVTLIVLMFIGGVIISFFLGIFVALTGKYMYKSFKYMRKLNKSLTKKPSKKKNKRKSKNKLDIFEDV